MASLRSGFAMGAVRFSTGQFLTEAEADHAVEEIARVVRGIREEGA